MGLIGLGSREIIGEFFKTLERPSGIEWISMVSMLINSDQASEEYKWLGMTPQMRDWVGGRNAIGFRENGITIINKHYEATIAVLLRELNRDKTGQAMVRIRELAAGVDSHWASLLSTLIKNGPSTVCYDGEFFFDDDHEEGDSGSQSNDISIDISALAAGVTGSITAPSVEEMQQTILKGISQIMAFKDDQGQPMNEAASDFLVMVPPGLNFVARQALRTPDGTAISEQNPNKDFKVGVFVDPRSSWTDSFAVFRVDGNVKPFIRQSEQDVSLKVKAEGSDFEFDNDAHQYGVDAWRNVGYGYWQHACYITMT